MKHTVGLFSSFSRAPLFINLCSNPRFTKLQVISLKQVLPRRSLVNCLQDALSSGGDSITEKERKQLKRGKDRLKFLMGRCPTNPAEVICVSDLQTEVT